MAKSKKKTPRKRLTAFRNDFYLLGMVGQTAPMLIAGEVILAFLRHGIWVAESVVLMRYLFGSEGIRRTFGEAVGMVFLVFGAGVIVELIGGWYYMYYSPKARVRVNEHLNRMLFDKASSVDISCFESPDFYGKYTLATSEALDRAMSVLTNLSTLVGAGISSVFIIGSMLSISPWAVPFILCPLVGNFVFGRKLVETQYERDRAGTPFRRRQDYVNRTVYLQKYAGEMRMTPLFSLMKRDYDTAVSRMNHNIDRFMRPAFWYQLLSSLLKYPIAYEGMWLVACFLAMVPKLIAVGDFVVLCNAVVVVNNMLVELTDAVTALFRDGYYVENFREFLRYTPKIDENQKGLLPELPARTLELRDVSFHYEGQSGNALSHVSMTLHSGKRNAIVGLNGAGKTTLVKLIMRLYDPSEGTILYNGTDIRTFDVHAWRQMIGATFQDFALFSATVTENVLLRRTDDPEAHQTALNALRDVGLYGEVAALPHGEDTVLTREFDDDGAVLSGGQHQKIAVARAFAKDSPVVILDEPSSALDPVAEHDLYENILRACLENDPKKGKIALIISHRLSAAAKADAIFVLRDGRLVEQGTHKELMAIGGEYAGLFSKQAQSYLAQPGEGEILHG